MQGKAEVDVEFQTGTAEGFGHGKKRRRKFGQLISALRDGDSSQYLTTQAVKPGADGLPKLAAPPVTLLAADVPLRPALMGNLVPQQLNMWMGAATTGALLGNR